MTTDRSNDRIADLKSHPSAFVTIPELAEYLDVPQPLVRKWIRAGALASYCFQGVWRVKTTDAIAFVELARLQH